MSCNEFTARRRVSVLAFGLATALVAGCASTPPKKPAGPVALTPTEQFQVKVASAPDRIALAVHPTGLSPTQKAALSGFVSRWRSDGGGRMTVAAPPGTLGAHVAAAAAVAEVVKLGVPAERVRIGLAPAGAPLLLSYERFQAEGPDCSAPWDDLTATGSNKVYNHFGCSVTANVAAQVANPRDFLAPAVVTPADDMRREVVLGKYRQGVSTSTTADQQASGKVSDVLQ